MDISSLIIPVLVGLALVLVGAWAIYVLLSRVSAEGGAVDGDAADIANQILAESDGFRGSRSSESPPWDGVNRLASPTQDGGGGSG